MSSRDPQSTKSRFMARVSSAAAMLAAAALVAVGCAAAPEVSVPETLDLDGFQSQKVDWVKCRQGALCAKVSAPLDWNDIGGETIELALAKLPARTDDPLGTIFVNNGGPGMAASEYVKNTTSRYETLREDYNIVGWDPRGVGSSTQVACFDDSEMDEYLFDVPEKNEDGSEIEQGTEEWLELVEEENEEFGQACFENSGDLIEHVGTQDTVQDLDLLRAIVGDKQLNYLGLSYGTFIGARYAETYPEKVGHLVLDGALEPTAQEPEVVLGQVKGFEASLRAYLEECLDGERCPFEGTVDEAMAEIHELLTQISEEPLDSHDGRKVTVSTMLTAIVTPLYSQNMWSDLTLLFRDAFNGQGDMALSLADYYYDRDSNGSYNSNSTQAFKAINCADFGQVEPSLESMNKNAHELSEAAPTLGPFRGYSDASCVGWPAETENIRVPVTAAGADPIMVIGTTGDPATPYQWAESLADQLESGKLVTYEGEGHLAFGDGSECISSTIADYFTDGKIPQNGFVCQQ